MLSKQEEKSIANVGDCLKSNLPTFQAIAREQFEGLVDAIQGIIYLFIETNFPSTPGKISVSTEVAEDLIETRPDWKLPDIKLFLKFIKHNQGDPEVKIMGNIITPLKLLELASKYEEKRSEARENNLSSYKKLEPITERKEISGNLSEHVNLILSGIKPLPMTNVPSISKMEGLFDPVTNTKDFHHMSEIIETLSSEHKNSWYESIEKFSSNDPAEIIRKETLLKKLKPETNS